MSPMPLDIDADAFRTLLEEIVPFNRALGLALKEFDADAARVSVELPLRDEHIGNVVRRMPHGGVIAALVDAAAGAAATLALDDLESAPNVATIDMRVDYLRPARGRSLLANAEVMRSGRSVVVVRTDVHDEDGALVALGSSAFAIGRRA
jgi:uncharacterized protein (TIGR00369 family)